MNQFSFVYVLVLILFAVVVQCSDLITGQLTFYGKNADSGGTCMLNNPTAVVATTLQKTVAIGGYTSSLCGICVEITPLGTGTGTSSFPTWGTFTAFVNNKCPECPATNLDLAETGDGIWDIQWRIVDCPVVGNILLQLKSGSSVYWTEISARNYINQLKSMEFNIGGSWVTLERQDYNYFKYTTQVTPPVQVRLTPVTGDPVYYTLTQENYQVIEPGLIDTGVQFAASGDSSSTTTTQTQTQTPTPTPTTQTTCVESNDCCYQHNSDDVYWVEVWFSNIPTGSVQVVCSYGDIAERTIDCVNHPDWNKATCDPNHVACSKTRRTKVQRDGYFECCTLNSYCPGVSLATSEASAENSNTLTLSGPAIAGVTATVIILVGLIVIIVVFVRTRKQMEEKV